MLIRKPSERRYENSIRFLKSECLERYYFLGRVTADGYVSRRSDRYFRFSLSSKEPNTLMALAELGDFPVYKSYSKLKGRTFDRYVIELSDLMCAGYLFEVIGDKKSKIYDFMVGKGLEEQAAFLTGYLDGDGNVTSRDGRVVVTFICQEPEVRALIGEILDNLGVGYTVHHEGTLLLYKVSSQKDVMTLKEKLYRTKIFLGYKRDTLNSASLSKRFRNMSRSERSKLLKKLQEMYESGSLDLKEFAKEAGIALDTARGWLAGIRGYDGRKDAVKLRNRDPETGRFM